MADPNDTPIFIPARKFTADQKAHRSNIAAIETFAQVTSLSFVPIGGIVLYAGSVAPPGYLMCDGSAVSRETYSALFSIIGTTYGAGDGSTTFNLPNLTGRHATMSTLGVPVTHTHTGVTTGSASTGTNSADDGYGLNYIIKT